MWGEDKEFREVLHKLDALLNELNEVRSKLARLQALINGLYKPVNSFVVKGDLMNITQGQSTTLTATPLDVNGVATTLVPGDVPAWSVSDPTAVVVVPSADGLSLSVAVNLTAPNETVVFQITDSTVTPPATGTFTLTIGTVVPPPNPVASFSIAGSAPVPTTPATTAAAQAAAIKR